MIQAINEWSATHSTNGHIIEDIDRHASQLLSFNFCHVNRKNNKVADALTKKAKDGLELLVWLEALPEDIAPILLYDQGWTQNFKLAGVRVK